PINAILGYSQLLLEEADQSSLSVAQRDDLERVADSGKQLLRIISEILDPAGITDGIEEYAFRLRLATRPPLTELRGCLETLLEQHENAPVAEDLGRIHVAAAGLSELVASVEHTFRVRVAATGDAPLLVTVSAEATEAPGDAGSDGGSILVIDDEEANRALLARRLVRQGYSL